MDISIRIATIDDLPMIKTFVDFWLSGRGTKIHAEGAVNDVFISSSQHRTYIIKYTTFLLFLKTELIGWAVLQYDNQLIHLLISGYFRGLGMGTKLLRYIKPHRIRSKSDQSSGDPALFYESQGYQKIETVSPMHKFNRNKINAGTDKKIDIYEKSF